MYKQKLCLSTSSQFGIPEWEQLPLFRQAGFEGFNVLWDVGRDEIIQKCALAGQREGMFFQSIHAPWHMCKDFWHPEKQDKSDVGIAQLKHCLDLCRQYGVGIMVCHVYVGFEEDYIPTQTGLDNFGQVTRYADQLGVKIAFENTEGTAYLKAVLDCFGKEDCVGFCWDTGHQLCYNFDENLMAEYGHLLIGTHLNDNLGIKDYDGTITWHDDLHLLPFDGIADWETIASQIAESGFEDILTFELNTKSKPNRHENDKYSQMPLEQYLGEAYARACRVARLIQKYRNGLA